MKNLPVRMLLSLLSFQIAMVLASTQHVAASSSGVSKQGSTTFNCVEDLPANFKQFTRASLILTGNVETVSETVKIRVYGVVNKPQGFLLVPSDIIEITPLNKSEYKAGSDVLVFATIVEQPQATNIVEIEHQNLTADLESVTALATRQLNFLSKSVKDTGFCKLLRTADAVVFGKVTCVGDGSSMSYGRHLTHWNKASFFITESLKGVDAGKVIQVEFPVSLSPVWKEWPVFVSGEESALVLKQVQDKSGQSNDTFVAETLSSKIPLEVFDGLKATATVRGIRTLTQNQTDVSQDQCREPSAAGAASSGIDDDGAVFTKAPASTRAPRMPDAVPAAPTAPVPGRSHH